MARDVKNIDPNNLIIIGLDEDGEGNPLEDERATWPIDENMVRNIMVYGIQLPVLIRTEAGKHYVIDGRQRVKCAREARTRQEEAGEIALKVPCLEVQAEDSRVAGIMVSANEIRQDDGILGKARKAERLMALLGEKEEVALAFGKSPKTIENWLLLLTAAPEVLEAVENNKISAQVGIDLARRPRAEQLEVLEQLLTDSPARRTPDSSSSSSSGSTSASGREKREQAGIKKGWLKKAMKTNVYENLDQDYQAVFIWFLTGHAPKDHWLDSFTFDADGEMGNSGE